MSSVLQQIAQQFEAIDPGKANELRRIDDVYTSFGFNDSTVGQNDDGAARRLLHYLPRMAKMRGFRLYRIGVGEQENGDYAHQAVALLDARHLPTPGNTLAVLDPLPLDVDVVPAVHSDEQSHQYFFETWQTLQYHYGHGCALIRCPVDPAAQGEEGVQVSSL